MLLKVLAFLSVIPFVLGLRGYTMDITDYTHTYNSNYYSLLTYRLIKVDGRNVLNGSAIYSRNIDAVDLRVITTALKRQSQTTMKVFDICSDLCKILYENSQKRKNILNYIVQAFSQNVSSFNYPKKCPYKKGDDHYMSNFYLDPEQFPQHVPMAKLFVTIINIHRGVTFYNSTTTVEVKPRYLQKNKQGKQN